DYHCASYAGSNTVLF
nr:immunoglobulin light chain junction region [Macaca mulatta]